MKRYTSKKVAFEFSIMNLLLATLGAGANLLVNPGVNKIVEMLPADAQATAKKIAPALKAGTAAAVILSAKKLPDWAKAGLSGFAIGGGLETLYTVTPQYFKLAGGADFFDSVGNTTIVELPIRRGGALNGGGMGSTDSDSIEVYGTGGVSADFFETI